MKLILSLALSAVAFVASAQINIPSPPVPNNPGGSNVPPPTLNTGTVTSTNFVGNGSGLTNVPQSAVAQLGNSLKTATNALAIAQTATNLAGQLLGLNGSVAGVSNFVSTLPYTFAGSNFTIWPNGSLTMVNPARSDYTSLATIGGGGILSTGLNYFKAKGIVTTGLRLDDGYWTFGSSKTLDNFTNTVVVFSANATATLPPASSVGNKVIIIKAISPATSVTITNANGTDTIEGSATYTLSAANKYVTLISDGSSKWWIIGNN